MKFRISISRKSGLAGPEGVETARALTDLGYSGITAVHFGRTITIEADDGATATTVAEMCERLLANPVIEDFTVEVLE